LTALKRMRNISPLYLTACVIFLEQIAE